MNTPADSTTTRVLLALWRARGEIAMQQLLRAAGVALGEAQSALELLAERGCRLERSPAGVALVETPLACWCDVIEGESRLANRVVGRRARVYSRTTSTNDVALQYAGDADADGMVVLADAQTAGRGRLGRTWSAAAGQSILMSVLLHGGEAESTNRLTLLAGLAAAVALQTVLDNAGQPGRNVEIKWPNDLLVEGKKIAGILVERHAEGKGVVVGIGVNIGQGDGDFPEALRGGATSMRLLGAPVPDRLRAVLGILAELERYRTCSPADDAAWIEQWKQRCHLLGQKITVWSNGVTTMGYVMDINPMQGLVLKDEEGAVRFFTAQTSSLI